MFVGLVLSGGALLALKIAQMVLNIAALIGDVLELIQALGNTLFITEDDELQPIPVMA